MSGEVGDNGGIGLDADSLLASLAAWSADERARKAVSARSRERWLRQQEEEAATWLGALVDLAERGQDAALVLADRSVSGRLVGVGQDLCVVAQAAASSLVALDHVRAVRVLSAPPASGSRTPPLTLSFAEALAALAAERSPVRLGIEGGTELRGTLVSVGVDVVSLRARSPERTMNFVRLGAIAFCTPTG